MNLSRTPDLESPNESQAAPARYTITIDYAWCILCHPQPIIALPSAQELCSECLDDGGLTSPPSLWDACRRIPVEPAAGSPALALAHCNGVAQRAGRRVFARLRCESE